MKNEAHVSDRREIYKRREENEIGERHEEKA